MRGEINSNFYCSAAIYSTADKGCFKNGRFRECEGDICETYLHKWPTPEQFKETYGVEYPEDSAVWFLPGIDCDNWIIMRYSAAKELYSDDCIILCICTPWGKPPDNYEMED